MNFKKLVLVASVLLLVAAFAGCAKKPRRPNPLDTVMGQGAGGSYNGDYVDPQAMGGETTFEDGTILETRGMGAEELAANGRRGVLPTVFFAFDSASIQPAERSKITQAADYLNRTPNAKLVMEGHADWRGTTEYNLALGDRRAKSVAQFLATLNVQNPGDRLVTLSRGDLNADENASAAQMAQDRKVELIVVD